VDHVAIMKKSWGLLPKILSGKKTIESRWYKNRSAPWGTVKAGDTVYFKNSGEKINVKAEVIKVLQFDNLDQKKVKNILEKYGKDDGIENIGEYFELFKEKKYCLLIFLDHPRRIGPLEVSKKGYGAMAAWMSDIKIPLPSKSLE